MAGYIKLYRGWHDSPQFTKEPYCERAAWCWLLTNAAWKDATRRNHKGEIVAVQRGQFHTSLRVLSAEWQWSIKRVRTFLKVLEKCEAIGTIGAHGGTTITICKYEEYQSSGHDAGTRDGTLRAQSGHIQEEGKEKKEERNDAAASPEKEFWDKAKAYLGGRNPGAMIGKWSRDYGKDEAKRAISAAQAEGAVDPIPYIERILRKAKREAEEPSFTGPC